MNWFSSLLSLLANLVGWGRETSARKNTEEIRANAKAKDDTKADDGAKEIVGKAAAGDKKALDDLRKELSE